jgi:hypothetical protein
MISVRVDRLNARFPGVLDAIVAARRSQVPGKINNVRVRANLDKSIEFPLTISTKSARFLSTWLPREGTMSAHAGGRAAGGGPNRASHRAGPAYERVSRAALLAGASVFALAALGASGVARAACVPSPQIIATPTSGPIFSNGGAITVTGSGSITGGPGGAGVDALTCPITTLANQSGGTISGLSGVAGSLTGGNGGAGVSNAGTIKRLSNSGTISGGIGGGAGGSGGRGGAGVANSGTVTTLTNNGTISGGNGGSATGAFGKGGSGGAGVSNTSFATIKTLTNSGTISGGAGGADIAHQSSTPLAARAARACRTPARLRGCPTAARSPAARE